MIILLYRRKSETSIENTWGRWFTNKTDISENTAAFYHRRILPISKAKNQSLI